MQFPTLYKKSNTGALQEWTIAVIPIPAEDQTTSHGKIITWFGQRYGQIQKTEDLVTSGKNPGKKNATTALQQAEKEAKARWEKQIKKGYVEDFDKATRGEDEIGGVLPMLAHSFDKHEQKMSYPLFVQPKLDGHRCIAIVEDGKAQLFSRTRKRITGMPHIENELQERFPTGKFVFDGELYSHSLKDNFEQISSLVRQEEAAEDHTVVQYHIYDYVTPGTPFRIRVSELGDLFRAHPSTQIVLVPTYWADSKETMLSLYQNFLDQGYEGAIVRNAEGHYEHKRSYHLQKVKQFEDAEFPIVGCNEGRGKLAGHAIFECETESGQRFSVKLKGDTEKLKEYYENPHLWQGKLLTVQFQGWSNKKQVPRFPVGLRIREDV